MAARHESKAPRPGILDGSMLDPLAVPLPLFRDSPNESRCPVRHPLLDEIKQPAREPRQDWIRRDKRVELVSMQDQQPDSMIVVNVLIQYIHADHVADDVNWPVVIAAAQMVKIRSDPCCGESPSRQAKWRFFSLLKLMSSKMSPFMTSWSQCSTAQIKNSSSSLAWQTSLLGAIADDQAVVMRSPGTPVRFQAFHALAPLYVVIEMSRENARSSPRGNRFSVFKPVPVPPATPRRSSILYNLEQIQSPRRAGLQRRLSATGRPLYVSTRSIFRPLPRMAGKSSSARSISAGSDQGSPVKRLPCASTIRTGRPSPFEEYSRRYEAAVQRPLQAARYQAEHPTRRCWRDRRRRPRRAMASAIQQRSPPRPPPHRMK